MKKNMFFHIEMVKVAMPHIKVGKFQKHFWKQIAVNIQRILGNFEYFFWMILDYEYRMRAIITCSWLQTALEY